MVSPHPESLDPGSGVHPPRTGAPDGCFVVVGDNSHMRWLNYVTPTDGLVNMIGYDG